MPPRGNFHQSWLHAHGAGKRALLVTEQLGFEQVLGQRGTVDGYESLGRPGAVGVNGARDQLLPGAGLAQHENIGLGARRLLDELEDLGHGRAVADHVFQPERGLQLLAQVAVLES